MDYSKKGEVMSKMRNEPLFYILYLWLCRQLRRRWHQNLEFKFPSYLKSLPNYKVV